MRILAKHDARGPGNPRAIHIDEGHRVARLVSPENRREVMVAADPLAVDLLELVVLIDAGGVERPGGGDQHREARRPAARLHVHVAEPGASGAALANGESGARKQPAVVGEVVSLDVAAEELAGER